MNTSLNLFISIILFTLLSCKQAGNEKGETRLPPEAEQAAPKSKEEQRAERRLQVEEQARQDSIRLELVLQEALEFASQDLDQANFSHNYVVAHDSIPVKVELSLDNHFDTSAPHLIIRREDPGSIQIDIFTQVGGKIERVLSHEQWALTYVNDTIRDIDGNGLPDFVVNGYGSSGCCLKGFSQVYLLRHDQKFLSSGLEFINPSFSPEEKLIRGVCYGHPGETSLYKYKWNGEKVDTLEYVSYERNESGKTGRVLISSSRRKGVNVQDIRVVDSVPMEYKTIEGYDWFTGKGYE